MRTGLRPSLEPPAYRRVNLDGRRPVFCVVISSLVILLIVAIFGISAWNVYSHQFDRNVHRFHAGDQVALLTVTDDLTSVFCDRFQIRLMEQDEAFLLPHPARVNQSDVVTSSFSLHHLPDRQFSFLEVYLLQASSLQLGACRDNGSRPDYIHILLIQGGDNFDAWRSNPTCSSCVFRHVTVLPQKLCEESRWNDTILTVTTTDTDRYFLVVHYQRARRGSAHFPSNGVVVNGNLNRTHYATHDYEHHCNGSRECNWALRWGTTEDIVINFDDLSGRIVNEAQQRTFTTKCSLRLAFWGLVFAGIPLLLGAAVAVVMAHFFCRRSRTPSLRKLSKAAEKRVKTEVTCERDDAGLVTHEVSQPMPTEDDGCMTIQDD